MEFRNARIIDGYAGVFSLGGCKSMNIHAISSEKLVSYAMNWTVTWTGEAGAHAKNPTVRDDAGTNRVNPMRKTIAFLPLDGGLI